MGQRRCCVTECQSSQQLPECADLKFHAFPTNEVVRNMWLKNCRIEQNRSITKSNTVCSKHFLEVDYQPPKNGRRLLNSNAVPTIFDWGNEKSFSDHMADQSSPNTETSSKENANIVTRTQSDTTPIAKPNKKMISRSQANSAAEKQRSASAGEQTSNDTKVTKARKSLDSAATSETPTGKNNVSKSPSKKFDIAMQLTPGAKVEVQDLSGSWHNASVVEVDQSEQEVLINFEKNVKTKGPTAFKLNDEWIAMDSSRLRIPVLIQFKEGDRCLARWTDSRKFPATVLRPVENNKYEVLFDDGCRKTVKGIHMSKVKRSANDKTPTALDSPAASVAPILTVTPNVKKPFKINPIPKFDLSKFNLPEIPEGEWCCPWINDTPIGQEGFLLNTDGTKRPTVLVQDDRLPSGWTKHLYQRSSTSGKWDVVLVGPNNKRFRSKNDVKVYLEDIGQSYNPDIYDFSIHKRRAKDVGVYVYTDDYVPPVISKPSADSRLDSSLDASCIELKPEPFTGFTPNESTSSILSKITQEIKAEGGTATKTDSYNPISGTLEDGFTYVGALKVQMVDNLFQCPKEGCNKSFRKENHLQIHVKHYHPELSQQLGTCPNMTELAYFRTMGTPFDESSPKNQIPNTQYFEKTFQSEIRTIRKSISPTRVKGEVKLEDQLSICESQPAESLKRKISTIHASPEVKEKRKPTDKFPSSDEVSGENMVVDDLDSLPVSIIPNKKIDVSVPIDSKPVTQKAVIPRFKIGHAAKLKGNKVARRKGKTFKKFKKLGKAFKRKKFEILRPAVQHETVGTSEIRPKIGGLNFGSIPHYPRPNRLKFLQYSSTDSNSENSNMDQRPGSRYINENGELIKIVRMRQEEIINCLCSYGEEDGLMIQCELCLCWQHGGCNGIEKESEVPEKYVCYICRNPERARDSMKYIHDQEWLYEGKLFHANYHQKSRQAPLRFDILKQSHTLTGNLLELKRSLHSLNVKINIAANKDHPKMYLWSKKWEQSPTRTIELNKAEFKAERIPITPPNTPLVDIKHDIVNVDNQQESKEVKNATPNYENQLEETPNTGTPSKDEQTSSQNSTEKSERADSNENQTPLVKQVTSPKKVVRATPNIPEPEAAIDSVECQHRLLEHIQKEQNAILSRMQTIDAQIIALESMDDHPDTNSKADFTRTSQTVRMLLNDLEKMQKLASINEQLMINSLVENNQYI